MRGLGMLIAVGLAPLAMAEAPLPGWEKEVGGAVVVAPAFAGSQETKARVLPLVHLVSPHQQWFISSREGLGGYVLKGPWGHVGAALTYVPGRESEDDDRIAAFEDIDPAAGARLFGQYRLVRPLSLYAEMTQQFGGAEGLRGRVGVGAYQPLSGAWSLSGRVHAEWANGQDQRAWFGVTGPQSAASGLPAYEAHAGWREVGAHLSAQYKLTPQWQLRVGGGVSHLLGDAADSPVSAEDTGMSVLTGVSYKF